jgi:hypothetical protein
MVPEALRLSLRYKDLRTPIILMARADDIHVTAKIHSERLHDELPGLNRLTFAFSVLHRIDEDWPLPE